MATGWLEDTVGHLLSFLLRCLQCSLTAPVSRKQVGKRKSFLVRWTYFFFPLVRFLPSRPPLVVAEGGGASHASEASSPFWTARWNLPGEFEQIEDRSIWTHVKRPRKLKPQRMLQQIVRAPQKSHAGPAMHNFARWHFARIIPRLRTDRCKETRQS